MFELLMLLGFVGAGMSHWIAPPEADKKTEPGEGKTPRPRARAARGVKGRSQSRPNKGPDEVRRRRFKVCKGGRKQPAAVAI